MLVQPSVPRVLSNIMPPNMKQTQPNKNAFGSGGSYDYAMPPHQLAHPLAYKPEPR
jgi:hypothetical protein